MLDEQTQPTLSEAAVWDALRASGVHVVGQGPAKPIKPVVVRLAVATLLFAVAWSADGGFFTFLFGVAVAYLFANLIGTLKNAAAAVTVSGAGRTLTVKDENGPEAFIMHYYEAASFRALGAYETPQGWRSAIVLHRINPTNPATLMFYGPAGTVPPRGRMHFSKAEWEKKIERYVELPLKEFDKLRAFVGSWEQSAADEVQMFADVRSNASSVEH